ncbi:MAG: HAMP domain-containing sensor histidine kinase [Acidimicrobiales bacterium]
MTFRSRVIFATVGVAAFVVIVACFASFLTTRNALMNSVDQSLIQASQTPGHHLGDTAPYTGSYFELVLPNGQTTPRSNLPIDSTIHKIAENKGGQVIRTVQFGGDSYRELIIGLPANSLVGCNSGLCDVPTTSAELFVVDITGQVNELGHLLDTLLIVAAAGVLLALGLGFIIARGALRPLEEVTNEIEEVAETNDMRHRIDAGGVDELGRLRRVFNRLLSTVESSQALQRQLVVDASHELRTPLTSLRTNAQVLSRASELSPEDLHQLTHDMVTQVDELAALVTDLGELARGERSEGPLESLRLDEIVDECVDTARTYARIREITIEATVEPSMVLGRRDRLVRALSNLLTNAVKFTPGGGSICVSTSDGTITVCDSGPGISEEDRAFVFDRFWRSASARALPGSGLGLSIVAQVVAELQGTVSVDTDPALGGARFTITLPTLSET